MEKEPKIESQKERSPLEGLADKLDLMQKEKNNGRGVSCVQAIIFYLREGDIKKAKAVAWNESDKIVRYLDIRKFLQKELYSGDDDKDMPPHFKTSSDELYEKMYGKK